MARTQDSRPDGLKASLTKEGMEKRNINEILNHNTQAIKEIQQVFEEHKQLETVVINPDSWIGKELLWQSKKLIDLETQLSKQQGLLNQLFRNLNMREL